MMGQNTAVHLRHVGEVAILDIMGDVTTFAEEKINQAYQQASQMGTRKIVLTFREEDYLNSAGIAIIIGITTESRNKGETLRIVEPNKHFQKIFDMIGLTQYVQVFETEQDALVGL